MYSRIVLKSRLAQVRHYRHWTVKQTGHGQEQNHLHVSAGHRGGDDVIPGGLCAVGERMAAV